MRRALATLLIAGGAAIGWSATAAQAATVADAGWWDRNADALLPTLDPPPEGALRVANDPTGTSAVAAVRVQLDDGERDPMLVLRVAGDPVPDGAGFVACPATSEWTGAEGAPLSEAPTFDCDASAALGAVAADGASVTFDFATFADSPVVDVVVTPAPAGTSPVADTFAVDFEVPTAADVTAAAPGPVAPAAPTGSPAPAGAGAPSVVPGPSSGGGSPAFSAPSSSGGFTAPTAPSVSLSPVEAPTGGDAPGGTAPIADVDEVAAAPLDALPESSQRWVALVTAAALVALGAFLWRADRARAVMTAGPVLGGLGPFVRERRAPAPDVT